MAQSCIRGGLDWTLGIICLLSGWSNTGTGLKPVDVKEVFGQCPDML